MIIPSDRQIGVRVCEAFGLEPDKTRNIRIHFEPDNVIYASCEVVLSEEQVEAVIKMIGGNAKPSTD